MRSGALLFRQRFPSASPYPRYTRCGNDPAPPPLHRELLFPLFVTLHSAAAENSISPREMARGFRGVLDHTDGKADACQMHKQILNSVRIRIKV